jgi:cyclophilin family peptidyl-prolyl cis-trans isomerase
VAALALVALVPASAAAAPVIGPDRVVLQTTAGDVVLGLYPQVAPKTVAHILDLVRAGAFDGADFFRVIPGFIAQVDVNERATPMPAAARAVAARTVPLEVVPGLIHQRGVLSMAHYDGKPNSGGTGFSILLGAAPSLDGKFTIFGDVEQGMDVVDEIAAAPLSGSTPLTPAVITHALVTDAAGLASMTLRGPVPIGTGTSAGPVSSWPRVLLTTSLGDILVTLSPRDAPQHVKLLQSLVGAGSYNGGYVGRADPGAYVQVFSSASEQTVTPLPLERGTVGNVAGALTIDSQDGESVPALTFLLSDDHPLDSRYTAVGWVTEGSDVLDAIAHLPTGRDHRPRQTVTVQKATVLAAGTSTIVIRGLSAPGGSTTGTPWGAFGFLVAAAVLGVAIFLFSKRLTPALTGSAGLLVAAFAFIGLWVGLVPHSAGSSQWLGVALFAGAVVLFRLMGKFERGRPVPAATPSPPPSEQAGPGATNGAATPQPAATPPGGPGAAPDAAAAPDEAGQREPAASR